MTQDHKFLWAKPQNLGWEFTGFCSCGFTAHARSAAAAHDKVWRHIKRMEWRKEDAEWLASLTASSDTPC